MFICAHRHQIPQKSRTVGVVLSSYNSRRVQCFIQNLCCNDLCAAFALLVTLAMFYATYVYLYCSCMILCWQCKRTVQSKFPYGDYKSMSYRMSSHLVLSTDPMQIGSAKGYLYTNTPCRVLVYKYTSVCFEAGRVKRVFCFPDFKEHQLPLPSRYLCKIKDL